MGFAEAGAVVWLGLPDMSNSITGAIDIAFFTLRDKFLSVYPFHIVFAPNSALFSNNFFEKGLFFFQKIHPKNKKFSSYRNIFSDFLSYGNYFFHFSSYGNYFFRFLSYGNYFFYFSSYGRYFFHFFMKIQSTDNMKWVNRRKLVLM